ncbi:MAG: hypothetical protein E6R14_00770 [Thermomicrobiales bacterium]|nr:MAG: hypothetical protein E6R14_00770 [Thermomicrobiales bacterium]
MSLAVCTCPTCGTRLWSWEEAFDKYGFDDGDGLVMTETVADALRSRGYVVVTASWGLHNVIITEITKKGRSLIPQGAIVGFDDPRKYLPTGVIALLDREFPDGKRIDV